MPGKSLVDYEPTVNIVAIVGMAGAGKSEVARVFEEHGFRRIRFGDITDQELKKRGLEPGEQSERTIREELRQKYGMAAYARLSLPQIDSLLKSSRVVIDGLYSWEEYVLLKERYQGQLRVLAVWASPVVRYSRLARRAKRPLTPEEAASRDKSEIEHTNKGGPIAMADFTILNEGSLEELHSETRRVISTLT